MKILLLLLLLAGCADKSGMTGTLTISGDVRFDGGDLFVEGSIECEDGIAPRIDDGGVGHCPYTYQQRLRAYNRQSGGAYFKGINDALEVWMLLDLELAMKGDRKTNGERANIVRERHGMEKQ